MSQSGNRILMNRREALIFSATAGMSAALGPAALTAVFSLVSGMGLLSMWGTPMWSLTGIVLVRLAADRWHKVSLRRCLIGVGVCFVLYPVCYLATTEIGPRFFGTASRTEWPAREISTQMAAVWERETHAPLRIVTGESWIAGLVSTNPQRPSVFIEADLHSDRGSVTSALGCRRTCVTAALNSALSRWASPTKGRP